jgi:hypothetical protein
MAYQTILTLTKEMHDSTFVAGANYGPWSLGGGETITKLQFQGCMAFESGSNTIGSTGYLSTYIKWGWQMGPTGYTPDPISTAAGRDSNKWIWYSEVVPSLPAYWTDQATTALWSMERYNVDMTFRCHIPAPAGTDIWLMTGAIIGGPPPGWMLWGSGRVTYSPRG